jgi:hypothetical protein
MGGLPVLRPNHPPIRWAPGSTFLEVKWPGREADHKDCGATTPLPICLHGIVFN